MNLQSIIITNCIGFTILVILQISSYLVRQRRQLSDKLFTIMIVMTAITCITEMFTFIIDGKKFFGAVFLAHIGNAFLYISSVAVSFMWCVYVDLRLHRDNERARKLYHKIGIPALIGTVAILFNFKFEFAFSIDENNIYHREPIGYTYYIIMFGYLIASIAIRQSYYKKYGKSQFFPIFMFLAPIFIGAVAQFLFYGVSLAWCCVALGLVGIYMSLQNELSYIDPLTKLYNRNYLDHILNDITRRNTSAGGLMIDLDYFKSINDMYGHSIGDEALIDTASIIRKVSEEVKAIPVRFAGDEFIIIMYTKNSDDISEIEQEIRNELKSFNEHGKRRYKLSFSIGKSMYTNGSTTDNFLNQMDERMYNEKKLKHSRH